MARRKQRETRPRVPRTDEDLCNSVEADLKTLEMLTASYDNGHTASAGIMASVISNILEASSESAVRRRGELQFPTPRYPVDKEYLGATNRLVALEVSYSAEDGCSACFTPWGSNQDSLPSFQNFRTWWTSEPIYIESTEGPPDLKGPVIFPQKTNLTWDQRGKLTRQQFIVDLRNAIGSHSDREIPAILADIRHHKSYSIQPVFWRPDGIKGTVDSGDVMMGTGPAEAMARQIAQEVLMAYGKQPLQNWPTIVRSNP